MEKQAHNIQDVFLNHLRREKLSVTIFLMGGVKLTGRIKSFDKFAVILESKHRDQLVFKHAIATVLTTQSATTGSAPPPLPTARFSLPGNRGFQADRQRFAPAPSAYRTSLPGNRGFQSEALELRW